MMDAPPSIRIWLRRLLPHSLRGRLLLSHLVVSLAALTLLAGFAASTLVRARLAEVEHALEDRGFLLSNSLEEPLRALRSGEASADAVLAVLAQAPAGRYEPELLVVLPNGEVFSRSPLVDEDPRAGPEVRAAFQRGDVNEIRVDATGREMMYAAVPILHMQAVYGVLRLATPMAPVREAIARALMALGGVVFGVAVLMSLVGWWLAEGLARPLERLTAAADRLALEHRSEPVPVGGVYELAHLAQAFNVMAERLRGTLDNQRAFVANASHELRTPLTSVKLRAEALRAGAWQDPVVGPRFLAELEGEVDRLSRLAGDLLDLSRIEAGLDGEARQPVEVPGLAAAARDAFAVRARRAGITLWLAADVPTPCVLADENQLYRLLNNLLDNAIKFTPAGGQVALRVGPASLAGAPAVALEVADTGAGIDSEQLPYIFDRFYRGDEARPLSDAHRPGSGLGLALVQSIVSAHRGQVTIASLPSQGTTVRVILPAAPPDRRPPISNL
jgi:signal transduction histidine kinase